jgi:hypothetical protein
MGDAVLRKPSRKQSVSSVVGQRPSDSRSSGRAIGPDRTLAATGRNMVLEARLMIPQPVNPLVMYDSAFH